MIFNLVRNSNIIILECVCLSKALKKLLILTINHKFLRFGASLEININGIVSIFLPLVRYPNCHILRDSFPLVYYLHIWLSSLCGSCCNVLVTILLSSKRDPLFRSCCKAVKLKEMITFFSVCDKLMEFSVYPIILVSLHTFILWWLLRLLKCIICFYRTMKVKQLFTMVRCFKIIKWSYLNFFSICLNFGEPHIVLIKVPIS